MYDIVQCLKLSALVSLFELGRCSLFEQGKVVGFEERQEIILVEIVDELGEAEGGGKDDYQVSISSNWVVMPFTEEEIRESICVCVWGGVGERERERACMHERTMERETYRERDVSFGHEDLRGFVDMYISGNVELKF